ncbi:MAG: hypothetical protein JW863_11705 [Chitinispirillaceae bacterium]|nr:hypothetical protein [Chitinispirillaceae bacterium]
MFRNLTAFITVFTLVSHAQVTVHINSGDPAYPFPQFQPYVNRDGAFQNVGTHNNVGVPHAEMEQTIRDAYQIMMNRAEKPGGGVGGIDYIRFRSNPQCSEGDGYGILGAASMADKPTFDGMWLYIHDFTLNKVKKYSTCTESSPGYLYSQLPGWTGSGANSATDGDVDIALALLQAYRQWGEFMGINDACGNPISYKQAAIDFLKALSDTLTFTTSGSLLSGDIGLDGYFKGGDSWAELSGWSTQANTAQIGISQRVEQPGPTAQYFDYTAPAYFHAFADFLAEEDSAKYSWNIFQFRRAAASSDWLIGELYNADPKNIPISGNVSLSGTAATFLFSGNMGEDFRLGWRTILNYLWHGTPAGTWNPQTHLVEPGTENSYELDMANRYARFLWDRRQSPWNHGCVASVGTDPFDHWGPMTLITNTGIDGSIPEEAFYFLNWLPAVGSPSAVISQKFDLMADLYRYIEIEWDVDTPGDGYLTSVPFYYHGWYRVLGLLVLSGNYQAPSMIKPTANTKVYCVIDKTFAFEKDTVTYTIDWRNYGSLDALGTVVVDTLHKDFSFVSATNGGVYNNTSHTVTWNIGMLPGFKTATGIPPTTGQAELKVVIRDATEKQYRNKASISCTNGTGWTSNDYPNRITAVMERNHLDIARRALICDYSASKTLVKPGDTVEFTIDFENSSDAGWINGGRPGVSFSFSQIDKVQGEGVIGTKNTMRTRLYHDAAEAYIDFGNYRLSYFLYDEKRTCISGNTGCTNGWAFTQTIAEGIEKSDVKLVHELIVPGQDDRGKWNQRLILQFSDPEDPDRVESLTTIDRHVSGYRGISGRIHRGGTSPLRLVWFFNASDWQEVNWGDAWSWDPDISQDDKDDYFPVTNDWTDPDNPDIPVDHWNRKACATAKKTVDNILIEEWDGYTWRRVAGNGPMPGREVNNVVIRDTIPEGFSFITLSEVKFNGTDELPTQPSVTGNRIITWMIPKMQIQEDGRIKFLAKADGSCPGTPDRVTVNRVWISADKESSFADSTEITISCDTVIQPPPPDHIDIIIDTLVIDSTNDNDFVRITLDEGTQTAVAYAVVRDKYGKFIRRVSGAQWVCRDVTVATAQSVSATDWQALITKVAEGSTIITVSEPGSPELKPDSLAITAVATPPWPVISTAIMYDDNADIIPDLLTVTLNDTFHVNQRFDSVLVDYRGTVYAFAAAEVELLQNTFSIQFSTLTTVDPIPSGQVTVVMTVDGQKKRITKNFTDGVGPALTAVTLRQDITGSYDTLRLTFTEDINMPTLIGQTLQLIKPSTNDTVVLAVMIYKGADIAKDAEMVVFSPSGIRPQEGDQLRLVPWVSGGTVADRKNNLPHLLNRPVVIPERPAQLGGGVYIDGNADGIVDTVYLQFLKPVQITDLAVTLTWGKLRLDNLSGTALSYGTDQKTVCITLPEAVLDSNGIKTDGAMFAKVQFISDVNEVRSAGITDGAAPVLTKALLRMGTIDPNQIGVMLPDTLEAKFSETIRLGGGIYPFQLIQNGTQPYTLALTMVLLLPDSAVFTVNAVEGVAYPASDDEMYINPVSAVGDSVVWQNNPFNRRVPLKLIRSQKWKLQVHPNPLNPDYPVFDNAAVLIRIVNATNENSPMVITNAEISIYDKVGNVVVKSAPFVSDSRGVVYYWNGTNRQGRKVGDGTYVGIVTVRDEGSEDTKRVSIGVARKRGGIQGQ